MVLVFNGCYDRLASTGSANATGPTSTGSVDAASLVGAEESASVTSSTSTSSVDTANSVDVE